LQGLLALIPSICTPAFAASATPPPSPDAATREQKCAMLSIEVKNAHDRCKGLVNLTLTVLETERGTSEQISQTRQRLMDEISACRARLAGLKQLYWWGCEGPLAPFPKDHGG
jgi:hypothetical protein